MEYDVVIVGSGLGGLACGTMLAKEGHRVCILERNKQIGGTLQTFVRDKVIFDSGVHYVGGLDKGQNLYQLFRYLGIMDKLKLRRLDEDVFDAIRFKDDPVVYKQAQGYENFIKVLSGQFPDEEEAIRKYCDVVRDVCSKFPLYNLRMGDYLEKLSVLEIDTQTFVESITSNKKLQSVLVATNLLYAGEPYKTPLFVHALVVNSYIESSWRFVDGGSQIARQLTRQILSFGGEIRKNVHVVKLVEEEGKISYAESAKGEKFYGKIFISNLHPNKTMEMTQSDRIKKVFRNRLKNLENSISAFSVNIVLHENVFPYKNYNFYYLSENDAWCTANYTKETWPTGFALYYSASSKETQFAEAITLMTYMHYSDVAGWKGTFNTVSEEEYRGAGYEEFKQEWGQRFIDRADEVFPGLKAAVKSFYVATPLTYRDYTGTDDGALYGFVKDYREPMKTFISPRTKIPNLFLTGQNLNLHGVLGVTVSAVLTCSEILGINYMIERIRNA